MSIPANPEPPPEGFKQFVKTHKTILACAATAVTSFVICKGVYSTSEHFYKGMYNGLLNSRDLADVEHLTLLEFLDAQNLVREFEQFSRQQNGV